MVHKERRHAFDMPKEPVCLFGILKFRLTEESQLIKLILPQPRQTAIVKGAALCGLGGLAPVRTRCRRHYGFTLGEVFREGIDSERHAYYDEFDGRKLCSGRMRWAISKVFII